MQEGEWGAFQRSMEGPVGRSVQTIITAQPLFAFGNETEVHTRDPFRASASSGLVIVFFGLTISNFLIC